jgi:hypothetical protein
MRLFLAGVFVASLAAAETPTYYKDVVPVLQAHCQECHRPGEIAPMSLISYTDSRPWAKAIRQAVLTKKMPPWSADPHYGKFSNDRSLKQSEIDTLTAWVDAGAPEGKPGDAPAPVHFADGWRIGKPDQVFDVGYDYTVPARGTVPYTYFVVHTGFTEDRWVKEIEVRPSNRAVVHHIVLYARPKGSNFFAGAKPGEPFVGKDEPPQENRPPQNDTGQFVGIATTQSAEEIGLYLPGGTPYETRAGQARLIPAGSDLVFAMHYAANGTAGVDRSKVGIIFAKEPPKERVVNVMIINRSLRIPPEDPNHRVDATVTLQQDAKLQMIAPHAHLRGKAWQFDVTYPTGETETLLKVPNYNFDWQIGYEFAKPVALPKGTLIHMTVFYDNSLNNRANPDPTKEVTWGDQTWNEMATGFLDFAIPAGMDPRKLTDEDPGHTPDRSVSGR